jgi:hypothetical protein
MMGGCIVQVWFEPEPGVKRPPFSMIETECPDFAAFCELVDANRLISGATLWTRRGEPQEMVVTGRRPIAFRGSSVQRCQLPIWRFVEDDAEGG